MTDSAEERRKSAAREPSWVSDGGRKRGDAAAEPRWARSGATRSSAAESADRSGPGPRASAVQPQPAPELESPPARESIESTPAEATPARREPPQQEAIAQEPVRAEVEPVEPARPRRTVQPIVGPRPFEMKSERRKGRDPVITALGAGAVFLLVWSLVLPGSVNDQFVGGWSEIADPARSSFLAALFGGGLLLVLALPMPEVYRTLLALLAGVLLVAFGVTHLEEDLLRTAYHNHPGLHFVVVDERAGLAAVLVSLLMWAGLMGRAARPGAVAPRLLAVLGSLGLLAAYFVLNPPGPGANTLERLFAVLQGADSLQGDVVASWLAVAPLVLAPLTLLTFLPAGRRAPTAAIGVLGVVLLVGALLVLSAHVAKPSQWLAALPAVKTTLLLGAGLLVAPAALGHLAARIG